MTEPGNRKKSNLDDVAVEDGAVEFVEELAHHYSPAPMTESDRKGFDRALAARLNPPHRFRRFAPALTLAAAAALLAMLAAPAFLHDAAPPSTPSRTEAFAAAEWESQLFETVGFEDADTFDDPDDLPADYDAIAGLLLDG